MAYTLYCRYERFVFALEEASRDVLAVLKDKALKVNSYVIALYVLAIKLLDMLHVNMALLREQKYD